MILNMRLVWLNASRKMMSRPRTPSRALKIFALFFIYLIAAIVGNTANYHIGKKIGNCILEKEYLNKAQNFYIKYGSNSE